MVISMPTLKPLDEDAIIKSAKRTGAIVNCEEHNIIGGLGAAVSEVVTGSYPVPVKRVGIPDTFADSGDYEFLPDEYGISVEAIVKAALDAVEMNDIKRI